MTGPIRQATQKALSLARVIQVMKATYLTGFILALAVMVGFILGVIVTTNLAVSLLPGRHQ